MTGPSSRPSHQIFGLTAFQTCIHCGKSIDMGERLPHDWGRDYFEDEYYKANEVPYVRHVWSEECDAPIVADFRRSHLRNALDYADMVIQVLDPSRFEWLERKIKNPRQGALRRYTTARIDQLGIVSDNPPRLRECLRCREHYMENELWYAEWKERVLGGKLDLCEVCLYKAFLGHDQRTLERTWTESTTRDDLVDDLARLVEALGVVPPAGEYLTTIVIDPNLTDERRIRIIDSLMGMAPYAIYKKRFGSWFAALVDVPRFT